MTVRRQDQPELYTEEEVKKRNAALGLFVLAGLNALGFVDHSIRALSQGGDLTALFLLAVSAVFVVVLIVLALGVRRGSPRALKAGLMLAVLTLVSTCFSITSALTSQSTVHLLGSIVAAVFALVFVVVLYQAYRSMTAARLATPARAAQDPLKDHCQSLIVLMARVMAADGHIDPRERKIVMGLFEGAGLSSGDIAQAMDRAIGDTEKALELAVFEYVESAKAIALDDVLQALIAALTTVAGSDGVLSPGEERVIREIARTSGLEDRSVDAHLAQMRADLSQMSADVAAGVLGVAPGATPEEIEAAHRSLTRDIESCTVKHLGERVVEHQEQRRKALERAREALLD